MQLHANWFCGMEFLPSWWEAAALRVQTPFGFPRVGRRFSLHWPAVPAFMVVLFCEPGFAGFFTLPFRPPALAVTGGLPGLQWLQRNVGFRMVPRHHRASRPTKDRRRAE